MRKIKFVLASIVFAILLSCSAQASWLPLAQDIPDNYLLTTKECAAYNSSGKVVGKCLKGSYLQYKKTKHGLKVGKNTYIKSKKVVKGMKIYAYLAFKNRNICSYSLKYKNKIYKNVTFDYSYIYDENGKIICQSYGHTVYPEKKKIVYRR